MAGKPSRKHRATTKQVVQRTAVTAAKPNPVTKKQTTAVPHDFPSVLGLSKQSLKVLWENNLVLGGIALIYCLLGAAFVNGFGLGVDVAGVRDSFGSRLVGGFAAYGELVGAVGTATSDSGGTYQLVFFMIMSLATIWALRQIYAGQTIRIRDAYYKGMFPLVPAAIVLFVMCLQLAPAVVAATIFQIVIATGLAANGLEIGLWAIGFGAFCLLSLFMLAASVQAFYIATLPDMTPLAALRSARKLVKGRRWMVLRKLVFMPFILLLLTIILMVPVIMLVASVAQLFLLLLTPLLVLVAHSYLYALYRELMHE